jgi:protein kinase/serine/threonine-protein kinase
VNRKSDLPPTRPNPERWQQLKNILADALEQSSLEARSSFLKRACAGDAGLLQEAENLLAPDTTVFEEFATFAATRLRNGERDRIGERLGAYAIVKELGRGGMGAVYLAERADGQFEKRVAIKVLKRGTDTDEVLRRFRIEQQILANLEHPNITRLLDAGMTPEGLPYFVMEFVEGIPITHFVEKENVDLRGRLKLFLRVCAAVALAHRHQVIHRDIKPSNVLVNAEGDPKLLDFGIAKLLGIDSDDGSTTIAGERRFTPAYAAPEQRLGHPATVATDVYALGALLYELVTGHPPCKSPSGNLPATDGSNEAAKPELPSRIVMDPKTKHQLQGTLDQIVVRAMQHDPARRYSSPTGLSADIEHYLNGAGPGSIRYFATARGSRKRWYIAAMAFGTICLTAALLHPLRRNVSKQETVNADPSQASAVDVPSIAVLPFDNLSEEKENGYFADGIQEDILTTLSKIGDLKVISRKSVMAYRGKAFNVRDVSNFLGVSAVLQGSVRRSGNHVRVNVQLINSQDEQIWAEDYDRDLSDVFAIQTDLAQKIARELHAKLAPAEEARIERRPTESGEAYLAFVQARNLAGVRGDLGKLNQSALLYERAIELDPKFALAIARYSELQSWIAIYVDRAPSRKEKARSLAERALELEPDLPEGHLALGLSHYYGDRNYDAALREFEIARRGLPNDAEVHFFLGAIQRRQGKWEESTINLKKAVTLNPNDIWFLRNLAFNYQALRNFDAANRTIDRALNIDPNDSGLWRIKATLAVTERGDLSVVEKALATMNRLPTKTGEQKIQVFRDRAYLLSWMRKYRELLQEADSLPDELSQRIPDVLGSKYYFIGLAREALNQDSGARAAFLKEKSIAELRLKQNPHDDEACIQLARVLARLGEKESALAEAQHAKELLPESKDAFTGPVITQSEAEIYATLGNNDRAIEILDGLLSRPGWLTTEYLKIDPVWDPLRNDRRFQALLTKYGGGG